jgi:hypothetical protein
MEDRQLLHCVTNRFFNLQPANPTWNYTNKYTLFGCPNYTTGQNVLLGLCLFQALNGTHDHVISLAQYLYRCMQSREYMSSILNVLLLHNIIA